MKSDICKESRFPKSLLAIVILLSCCMIAGCANNANLSQINADTENTTVMNEDEAILTNSDTTTLESGSVSDGTETVAFIAVSGAVVSEDENAALYEQVKSLLEKRQSLQDEMETGNGVSYMESVAVDGEPYYLVTTEEIDSWNDYEKLAQEIYTEDYVTELFTPTYSGLYTEANGKLYRAAADGFTDVIQETSVIVYKKTENVYVITAETEKNAADSSYTLVFIVQANRTKPYGLEIRDELKLYVE